MNSADFSLQENYTDRMEGIVRLQIEDHRFLWMIQA
jgi:hypothetical protein